MRTIRLVIAVLFGLALAAAPVAAGFAMAPAGQSKVPAAFCPLKCCSVAAILVEAQPLTGPAGISRTDTVAAALSPFSRQPDPPPPRS